MPSAFEPVWGRSVTTTGVGAVVEGDVVATVPSTLDATVVVGACVVDGAGTVVVAMAIVAVVAARAILAAGTVALFR